MLACHYYNLIHDKQKFVKYLQELINVYQVIEHTEKEQLSEVLYGFPGY